jgi:hypothetical protein
MITGNISFRFLDNPFWMQFIRKLRPAYKSPTTRQFATLLSREYEQSKLTVTDVINNADFVSLTSDGWTDVSRNRLINVIAHTPDPLFYDTIDATMESHTGDLICELLASRIEIIGARKVVALVTDNASNLTGRVNGAWTLLKKRYPWLITEGCKAHSIDLAAKDFVKLPVVSDVISNCTKIAKFFRYTF